MNSVFNSKYLLRVCFVLKKKGIILMLLTCIVTVLYGFINISNGLPKFIKDRSNLKINYTIYPVDFRIDLGEYSLYVNQKIFANIKDSSVKLVANMENKVQDNTNNIINNTSNVFKNMESKISDTIHSRFK
jgi:hypothetical protein